MPPRPSDTRNDLISGSLWISIWRISWPIVLIMLLNFSVGVVDVYVAGLIGPEVQAAVGFISQIYFFVVIVANAISIGTLAVISRAVGSRNWERAIEVARQSLIFSFFVAIGIMLMGFVFSREIVVLAGLPEGITRLSERLFRIFAAALAANYVLIVSNAVFRASGEVRRPLFTMAIVSAVNIAGNFLFVFGAGPFPGMGPAGIAVAAAVSLASGMAVNLVQLKGGQWESFYRGSWRLSKETLQLIVALGWPAALLQIAWNAGTIVLYNILARFGDASVTALASITNGLRIEAIVYLPAFALNMASSVLVGQSLGASDPDRAERVGWRIAKAGVLLVCAMSVVIFAWADRFSSLVASDPAVREETARYLRINMVSEPFMALSAALGGGLQGAGDTKGAMWVIVLSMWIVRLPLAYLFGLTLGLGATGVWVSMVISMALQGSLMAARFRRGGWKDLKVG